MGRARCPRVPARAQATRTHFLVSALAGFAWTSYCAANWIGRSAAARNARQRRGVDGLVDRSRARRRGRSRFRSRSTAPRPAGVPPRDSPYVVRPACRRSRPEPGLRWWRGSGPRAAQQSGRFRLRTVAPRRTATARRATCVRRAIDAGASDLATLVARCSGRASPSAIGRARAPDAAGARSRRSRSASGTASPSRPGRIFGVTGTSHLVAVSGMHVALLGVRCSFASNGSWCACRLALPSTISRPPSAACALATFDYAAFTGLAVPAQRSLLMIVVALACTLSRRCDRTAARLGGGFARDARLGSVRAAVRVVLVVVRRVAILLRLAAPRRTARTCGRRSVAARRAGAALTRIAVGDRLRAAAADGRCFSRRSRSIGPARELRSRFRCSISCSCRSLCSRPVLKSSARRDGRRPL